ncbi:MAG TPA: LysR family transcriptional regulator, partial [Sphingomicrobium sp.]
MANPGFPTLDQLRIFLAVVDEGSFNGAARKRNRAV